MMVGIFIKIKYNIIMKQIWKFKLEITDEQIIDLPKSAKLLTIQMQGENPVLWVIVKDGIVPYCKRQRKFVTFGTGITLPERGLPPSYRMRKYIGTYQKDGFVGHVFEEIQ